jgi:hypothetical protein
MATPRASENFLRVVHRPCGHFPGLNDVLSGNLREAKIQNFRVVALCHKDIRGFDVPMNDAFRMRGIESVRNFDGHVEDLVDF